MSKISKESIEIMKISDILYRAAREANLDGHIKIIENKKDEHTYAEKIAGRFRSGHLPVKNSYMFCDALDMCFFVTKDLTPTFAYAGYSAINHIDVAEDKLLKAFSKAKELLQIIDRMIKEEKCEQRKHRKKGKMGIM